LSRGDRWALVALALGLGGCMRIYPDPELPDVVVDWFAELNCGDDSERVVVLLSALDSAAEDGMATAPCRDSSVRIDDVARERYHIIVRLEDTAGAVLSDFETDIDLRDGLSERVSTFLQRPRGGDFLVAWDFDMGASCESLSVAFVLLRASMPGGELVSSWSLPCEAASFANELPSFGELTLSARAMTANAVVATSPESAPLVSAPGTIVDFGTLTLTPCADACPPLAPVRSQLGPARRSSIHVQ
jgi:hypothetical protein